MARSITSASTYLSVGDVAALDITGTQITVAAWINPTTISGIDVIAGKWASGALAYVLYLSGGSIAADFGDGGGTNDGQIAGATPLSTGVWSHAALRKNGSNRQVFRNGTSDASAAVGLSIGNSTAAFLIGLDGFGASFFDGLIAEVGVWNTGLSDDEIVALSKGFSPTLIRPQSLVGYWPLLGNASPEPDFKNGNNASLVGSPAKADHTRVIMPREAIYIP